MSVPANEFIYDKDFIKDVRKLPDRIQSKLSRLLEILKENVFDPRLHTKPLSDPLQGMFSLRVTRGYRVGFRIRGPHVIHLLAVDTRDKIYRRLLGKI